MQNSALGDIAKCTKKDVSSHQQVATPLADYHHVCTCQALNERESFMIVHAQIICVTISNTMEQRW